MALRTVFDVGGQLTSDKPSFFTRNMPAKQFFGESTLADWASATSRLPSQNKNPTDYYWGRISWIGKIRSLISAMPSVRYRRGTSFGLYPAEWLILPLWLFNFVFGHVANILGFTLKVIGDLLAYCGSLFITTFFNLLFAAIKDVYNDPRGGIGSVIILAILVLLLLPIWLPVILIPTPLWILAQPFHLLSNTINYLRFLLDGITCAVIWVASGVTWIFNDTHKYPSILYSLEVIAKNALLLAPIALIIAFSIVPFAGPVGAFFGSVVLNVGFTSIFGAINLAIAFGLTVGYQAFAAVVEQVELWAQNLIRGSGVKSGFRRPFSEVDIRRGLDGHMPRSGLDAGIHPVRYYEGRPMADGAYYDVLYQGGQSHPNNFPSHIFVPHTYSSSPIEYCNAFILGYQNQPQSDESTASSTLIAGYRAGQAELERKQVANNFRWVEMYFGKLIRQNVQRGYNFDLYKQGYYSAILQKKANTVGMSAQDEISYNAGHFAGGGIVNDSNYSIQLKQLQHALSIKAAARNYVPTDGFSRTLGTGSVGSNPVTSFGGSAVAAASARSGVGSESQSPTVAPILR